MSDNFFVTAWYFRYAYRTAISYGIDAEELTATLNFPPEHLNDPGEKISWEEYTHLFENAVRISGNDFIWFQPLNKSSISRENIVWYYSHNAPTLFESTLRTKKYFKLFSNLIYYETFVLGDEFITRFGTQTPRIHFTDHQSEWLLIQWKGIRESYAGPDVKLKEVRTRVTNPKRLKIYEDYFRAPVQGGSEFDDLVYDRSVAELPNANDHVDSNLDAIFKNLLEKAITTQHATSPFEKELMAIFQIELQSGTPTLESIAPKMGMSARTLQRRLTELGHTFTEAVLHYRHHLAATYLMEPHLHVTDVAFMVGYSSLTAFGSAFQKFHGTTPSEYRKKHIHLP